VPETGHSDEEEEPHLEPGEGAHGPDDDDSDHEDQELDEVQGG
jgi:hypothetical protein